MPAGELRGRLRIAAPLSLGPTHLAPAFAEMARRHPLLHLQASYSDHFVDIIGEGFDCAIRVGYLSDSNLIARRNHHADFATYTVGIGHTVGQFDAVDDDPAAIMFLDMVDAPDQRRLA